MPVCYQNIPTYISFAPLLPTDRREMLRHLDYLYKEGFTTLLYDAREHGISDGTGKGTSLGIREQEDVFSAVAFMRQAPQGCRKVVLFGTSTGASSAIVASSICKDCIDMIIAENPFTSRKEVITFAVYQVLFSEGWGRTEKLHQTWVGSLLALIKSQIPRWFADLIVHISLYRMGEYTLQNFTIVDEPVSQEKF